MTAVHPLLSDRRAVQWMERLTNRGCFVVDAQRIIVAIGPLAERVTGYRAAEVEGRLCLTALRCHRCVEGCAVMERGLLCDAPLTLYQKDGSTVDVRKSGVALYDEQGELVGAVELVWKAARDGEPAPGAEQALDHILMDLGRWFVATDAEGGILCPSPCQRPRWAAAPGRWRAPAATRDRPCSS